MVLEVRIIVILGEGQVVTVGKMWKFTELMIWVPFNYISLKYIFFKVFFVL